MATILVLAATVLASGMTIAAPPSSELHVAVSCPEGVAGLIEAMPDSFLALFVPINVDQTADTKYDSGPGGATPGKVVDTGRLPALSTTPVAYADLNDGVKQPIFKVGWMDKKPRG